MSNIIKYLLRNYFPFIPFIVVAVYFVTAPWFTMFTLTCERLEINQGICTVRQSILAITVKEFPLQTLQQAESKSTSSARSSSSWVVLQTSTGSIELPKNIHGSRSATNLAIEVNTFINHPEQKTLRVSQNESASGFVWGMFFLFTGVFALWVFLQYQSWQV
ncbi:hypothetical protein NIES4074_30290 [Cylindrospermum sp. NIES-4074]|nr:hypothetical protein NIES4074_30290 [Cylindrospermum sp. NIES-4074]